MNYLYGNFAMSFSHFLYRCIELFGIYFELSTLHFLLPYRRQLPLLPRCYCEIRTAAVFSLISAARVQFGGASRISRRFFAHKILIPAPCSPVPADHFGDNFLFCVNFKELCNTALLCKTLLL
jgi:hypothetical protein